MRTFRMPKVFLLIRSQDLAGIGDEVCNINELIVIAICAWMKLDNCTRNDTDIMFFCQSSVFVKINLPFSAGI